jgi:hypothetical protein
MIDRMAYTYVLLRYRHDSLSGEFANVGVVVHSPGWHFLGSRVRKTVGRLSKMFPDLDRAALMDGLRVVERGLARLQKSEGSGLLTKLRDAESFAKLVLPPDDSSLIWSSVGSGVTQDPLETLESLYRRFISRYDESGRVTRDDAAVWQPVREKLVERNLADRLQPKLISSPIDEVEFQHAWKNGAWHCYQPLSFDLVTSEGIREKAARWAGHMTGLSRADEKIKPHFIVGPPTDPKLGDDYRRALDLLRASALNPDVYEEREIDKLVANIEREMGSHDQPS